MNDLNYKIPGFLQRMENGISEEELISFLQEGLDADCEYDMFCKDDYYNIIEKCCQIGSLHYLKIVIMYMKLDESSISRGLMKYCLIEAIKSESMDIIDYLIYEYHLKDKLDLDSHRSNKPLSELQRKLGPNPLCSAIQTGNIDIVRQLIEAGAKIQYRYSNAVYWCVKYLGAFGPIWDILLCYGADINFIDTNTGEHVFHAADENSIKQIILMGGDLNILNNEGKNLLEISTDRIQTLIRELAIPYCNNAVYLIKAGCIIPNDETYDKLKIKFKNYINVEIDDILPK